MCVCVCVCVRLKHNGNVLPKIIIWRSDEFCKYFIQLTLHSTCQHNLFYS